MEKIHYARERNKSQVSFYILIKRIIDIVVSFVLLLCLSPFLLLFSIAILIFSGRPIFFKQSRTGKHNQPFTIWKFRTMQKYPNSKKLHNYQWLEGVPNDFLFETPTQQKITRIGKIYRKLSIDELPQLFNVLRGDMSLIGPRPEIPEITQLYSRYQAMRLKVKPGMSGYAQINGRSVINHGMKIEYDLYYIENQSIGLDVKIFFKTIGLVIRGKGAW
ncbi:sugar transferase [Sporosarcina sp. Marseille-Q4063]|uniref:sugar transferase n=1 Tax=Sporosarcina sp. Marseille-Q4063 TaxID=2810514 RepID=UPI001BAEEA94|nr:sugar transferase [Sporosarcina sp. Marseille-Q4063]QUW23299.1 sugar transferase [Sporosarcina sp. Marseille-Q4063]